MIARALVLALALSLTAAIAQGQDRAPAPAAAPAADALDGEKLFVGTCGFCHQNGGRAAGRGPKLAGTERSDADLMNRIRLGKEGAMPAFGRAFTDAQLRAIIAYIRSLKEDER
ncbi:MAG TPA: cytochrome c [Methylomirabilota bacterium]